MILISVYDRPAAISVVGERVDGARGGRRVGGVLGKVAVGLGGVDFLLLWVLSVPIRCSVVRGAGVLRVSPVFAGTEVPACEGVVAVCHICNLLCFVCLFGLSVYIAGNCSKCSAVVSRVARSRR